jgi:exosortase F-associated protein
MAITGERFQRLAYGGLAVFGLALVYIFQYTDFLLILTGHPLEAEYHFISNRLVRIFLNDTCMLVLIFALFKDSNAVRLAFYIQLIDILILFPLYVLLKLPAEGVSEHSSAFLSQFHRLIVNPTLMVLLIAGMYYQKLGTNRTT